MAHHFPKLTFGWYQMHEKLDPSHELVLLGSKIDWDGISEALHPYYKAKGRRHLPIRLMVGLHLLKHRYNLSDVKVVQFLRENWYWQYFCDVSPDWLLEKGKKVLDRSSMSRFRGRIGDKGVALIEQVIRDQLIQEGKIDVKVMTTDSTAMEKNVAYPTDSSLLERGRRKLVKVVHQLKSFGVRVGKSFRNYGKKGKQAILSIIKLGKDRKERIEKKTLELAKYARHVVSQSKKVLKRAKRRVSKVYDIVQKISLEHTIQEGQRLCKQVSHVIHQSKERFKGNHIPNKLYSYHEPQVTVIAKGKRSKPREYGCKVNLSVDSKGFIVTHQEYTKNIHDAKLLDPALKEWDKITGQLPHQLNIDRGYRQQEKKKSKRYRSISNICLPFMGQAPSLHKGKKWYNKGLSQRATIEAIIGHLKQDHRMNKSRYQGFRGDKINMTWATLAWNTKKWIAA